MASDQAEPALSRMRTHFVAAFLLLSALTGARAVDIALPTDNDALYRDDGPAFYQYIERDYEGAKSTPWEGGRYGFVRDPLSTSGGVVFTRFHEGIDIKPVHRDENNEPLDEVRAIGDGKVVHANPVASYSNYGRYVVVEHNWGGSPYYSLYGHLNRILVKVGETVQKGSTLAIMGYTGEGINRERAHVHLELNLMLNPNFQKWYDFYFPGDPNHNGAFNGLNLSGLNIAKFFLALHKNPSLTVPEFLAGEEVFYKVAIPKSRHFELARLYPWMVRDSGNAHSWEVSFTRSGLPLRIDASEKKVKQPELSYVKKGSVDYNHLTRGDLMGHGDNGHLSPTGLRNVRLLIYPD